MLTQELELQQSTVIIHLHNPVQETLLHDLRLDITSFLRAKLSNATLQVTGFLNTADEKKHIYTNRDKFEHLLAKNPSLKELKDKLGLDPEF